MEQPNARQAGIRLQIIKAVSGGMKGAWNNILQIIMNRREEFEKQLKHDDERVVHELLHDPDKVMLRNFYEARFDEISALIANCRNTRIVIEDICNLESEMQSLLMENFLFVKQVNDAIKNGVLKKEQFENDR